MRVEIHVRPNSSGTVVGGTHDGALVVRVAQPPDQGKATAAALEAVADALGVPRRAVTLVRGATGRRKLIDVAVDGSRLGQLQERLSRISRTGPGGG